MKQLLILSGKGGTGKTTVASAFVKLASAQAVADCDVDAPNLHLVMQQKCKPRLRDFQGLPKAEIDRQLCTDCGLCRQHCRFQAISNQQGRYEVDYYGCEGCGVCSYICPEQAITLKPAVAGELKLYLGDTTFSTAQLRMGSGNSGLLVTEVRKQLKQADGKPPLAIIDGSPGIGCPVIASVTGVDLVLVVTEPSVSGISDMVRVLQTAHHFNTKTAVCINKHDTNRGKSAEIIKYCQDNSLPFVGCIPYDPAAVAAINAGHSIVDSHCPAGQAATEVFNKTMELLNSQEDRR